MELLLNTSICYSMDSMADMVSSLDLLVEEVMVDLGVEWTVVYRFKLFSSSNFF